MAMVGALCVYSRCLCGRHRSSDGFWRRRETSLCRAHCVWADDDCWSCRGRSQVSFSAFTCWKYFVCRILRSRWFCIFFDGPAISGLRVCSADSHLVVFVRQRCSDPSQTGEGELCKAGSRCGDDASRRSGQRIASASPHRMPPAVKPGGIAFDCRIPLYGHVIAVITSEL
jgi:hypothetical protein